MKLRKITCGFIVALLSAGLAGMCVAQGEQAGSTSRFNRLMDIAEEVNAKAAGDLGEWQLFGTGDLTFDGDENAFRLSETPGSVGVTLVSPEMYGSDVTVTFMAKPVTHASVNVVMLNVSDVETGGDFEVPKDYDGGFGFWTSGTVQNYLFAFHNAAHDRLPFIVKCPGVVPVAEGAEHHVEPGRWQKVEITRKGKALSLKVNGIIVVEGADPDTGKELPGGRVCLRLRGTKDGLASCLFKSVEIIEHAHQ